MADKGTRNWIGIGVKVLLSAVFLLSAVGKLISPAGTAASVSELLYIPGSLATALVVVVALLELLLVWLIWRAVSKWLILVPLVFMVILGVSQARGLDCGCFGELPLLSSFPVQAHWILNIGLLAGLWFLAGRGKSGRRLPGAGHKLLGVAASLLLLGAFAMVPQQTRPTSTAVAAAGESVDMAYVENVIQTGSALLIDARSESQYLFGHIDGAINIPATARNVDELLKQHEIGDQPLVVYCTNPRCHLAEMLADKLITLGYKNFKIYPGGWDEWEQSHY